MKLTILPAFLRMFSPRATAKRNSSYEAPKMVHCTKHGHQPEAFVCQHIVEGLVQRNPVGFFWSAEDPSPYPDAWCSECNDRVALTGGEWVDEALVHLDARLMCSECYQTARTFHMGGEPWS